MRDSKELTTLNVSVGCMQRNISGEKALKKAQAAYEEAQKAILEMKLEVARGKKIDVVKENYLLANVGYTKQILEMTRPFPVACQNVTRMIKDLYWKEPTEYTILVKPALKELFHHVKALELFQLEKEHIVTNSLIRYDTTITSQREDLMRNKNEHDLKQLNDRRVMYEKINFDRLIDGMTYEELNPIQLCGDSIVEYLRMMAIQKYNLNETYGPKEKKKVRWFSGTQSVLDGDVILYPGQPELRRAR